MTAEERQAALIDEVNSLGDCFEQYSYLIFRSGLLPPLDPALKTEENLVRGCQSVVWAVMSAENGIFHFAADSDTLIIKGVLSILAEIVDGALVGEIRELDLRFLRDTELAVTFESERMTGIGHIFRAVKEACMI